MISGSLQMCILATIKCELCVMFKFCHNPPADYGRAVGRWGEMDLKLRAGFRGGCRRVQPVTKAKALGPLSVAVRCPLSDCTTGLCRSPCVVLYRTAQLASVVIELLQFCIALPRQCFTTFNRFASAVAQPIMRIYQT